MTQESISAPWRSYVAIGDSFTEGLWDADSEGQLHGWADRLAMTLSERRIEQSEDPLTYANLAIRGRLMTPIMAEQLEPALSMKPDLISIVAGGNNMLRPATDVEALVDQLEAAVIQARSQGADVLLATSADPGNSLFLGATRGRAARFYASIWSIAQRHHAYVADLWGMRSLKDWRMWSDDRIHLTPEGHRRVADAAMVGLGQSPRDPNWDKPLPQQAKPSAAEQFRTTADWVQHQVLPWIGRHIQGRSSGDGRQPKRPTLQPIVPEL